VTRSRERSARGANRAKAAAKLLRADLAQEERAPDGLENVARRDDEAEEGEHPQDPDPLARPQVEESREREHGTEYSVSLRRFPAETDAEASML
jgi:hypothetical protein